MKIVEQIAKTNFLAFIVLSLFLVSCGEADRTETAYEEVKEEAEQIAEDIEAGYEDAEYTARDEAENLLADIESLIADIRDDVDPEKGLDEKAEEQLENLKAHRDELRSYLEEMGDDADETTWDEIVSGFEASIEEIRDFFEEM